MAGLLIRDEENAFYERRRQEKKEGYTSTIGSEIVQKKQSKKDE